MGNMTTITKTVVSVNAMLAAISCASGEEHRPYLQQVFVHRVDHKVRLVSSDGHRLFVYAENRSLGTPAWLNHGIGIDTNDLKPKLSLISKLGDGGMVGIDHKDDDLGFVTLSDLPESMIFRHSRNNGQFVDYQRVIDGSEFVADTADYRPVAFSGKYLKAVGDMAKVLTGDKDPTVQVMAAGDGQPAFCTFPDVPGAVLYLMPRPTDKDWQMPEETREILDPSIKRTLAALKAHETRNREQAKEARTKEARAFYNAKAEDFATRIKETMERVGDKSLPAPKAKPETDALTKKAAIHDAVVARGGNVIRTRPGTGKCQTDPKRVPAKHKSGVDVTPGCFTRRRPGYGTGCMTSPQQLAEVIGLEQGLAVLKGKRRPIGQAPVNQTAQAIGKANKGYAKWKSAVTVALRKAGMLAVAENPTVPFGDWFKADMEPTEAAARAVQYTKKAA